MEGAVGGGEELVREATKSRTYSALCCTLAEVKWKELDDTGGRCHSSSSKQTLQDRHLTQAGKYKEEKVI
ncbi:Hypothetical predicted protein, partial [Podarcis lilfordi]